MSDWERNSSGHHQLPELKAWLRLEASVNYNRLAPDTGQDWSRGLLQHNCIYSGQSQEVCLLGETEREDCGYYGIRSEECVERGCCWQPSEVSNTPWCFFPSGRNLFISCFLMVAKHSELQ